MEKGQGDALLQRLIEAFRPMIAEEISKALKPSPLPDAAQDDLHALLFVKEVAQLTRIPVGTLNYYRTVGQGPAWFTVGRRVVYERSDVTAWMRRRKAESQEQRERVRRVKVRRPI